MHRADVSQAQRSIFGPGVAATAKGAGARIVLVDDQEQNVTLFTRMLESAGYRNVRAFADGRDAAAECLQRAPDLLLLDLHMPGFSGFEVLAMLHELRLGEGHFPAIMLTADSSTESRLTALAAGADDFLTKPLDPMEALLRVRNLLETHLLHRSLLDDRERLEVTVQQRTRDLELARTEVLEHLALASEYRDDETHEHARRIGRMTGHVARAAGFEESFVALMERAAPLHDIGKLAVPDAILLKPGPLDDAEIAVMRRHTTRGAEILGGSGSPLLRLAEVIAGSHHERWDGCGYPAGLAGAAIPEAARAVSLVDVFDALIHERPYKPAWPVQDAVDEIARCSGTQFDPALVDVFMTLDHAALADA